MMHTARIELATLAWKARIIPLNYVCEKAVYVMPRRCAYKIVNVNYKAGANEILTI